MIVKTFLVTFIIASSILLYNGYRYNPKYKKEQLCKDIRYRCLNYYSNDEELRKTDKLSLEFKKYMDEKCKDYNEEISIILQKSNKKNGIFVLCVLLYVTLIFNYM